MFHFFRNTFYLLLILYSLAACTSATDTPAPTPAPTPSPVVSTLQPLPPTAVPDTPITLTLWLPTRFNPPADDNPVYQILRQQLDDFARTADGVPSQIVIKQDRGPGGLLDLLRTASPVAPGVLPDVIALESTDLETAARAGLLKPIGSQLPAGLTDRLLVLFFCIGVIRARDRNHPDENFYPLLPGASDQVLDGYF